MSTPGSKNVKTSDTKGAAYWPLLVLSILLIAVFIVLSVILFNVADDKDTTEIVWSRYAYIVGGIEAIVFAAVGWLFGREVNRGTADLAKSQAEEAKGDADAGKAVAGLVRGYFLQNGQAGVLQGAQSPDALLVEVDRLFPPNRR